MTGRIGTRDSAITAATVVDLYLDHHATELSGSLVTFLDAYTSMSHELQHLSNPSGSFEDLQGLGEPKFMADGSAFAGSWGRPQRDGPALRAITLMLYMHAYNQTNPSEWAGGDQDSWYEKLYHASMPANSTIKADLEYVSHFWRESGFDLWEEVEGKHFFTAMVQLRALREGAKIARIFGDKGAARWYKKQAEELKGFMHLFWDDEKGHLVETLASDRTGLDCAIPLGAIHGTGEDGSPYPPYSDEVLVSVLGLIRDQRNRFPINKTPKRQCAAADTLSRFLGFLWSPLSASRGEDGAIEIDDLEGVGIGRYPEDVYDGIDMEGGNPWFLCTCSVAETLYRTAEHLESTGKLVVTERGLPFWRALLPDYGHLLWPGSYAATSMTSEKARIIDAAVDRLKEKGDSFMEVVKTHADAEGALSEQFDAITGFERGARDLTWSYGAFLQAARARRRALGRAWKSEL